MHQPDQAFPTRLRVLRKMITTLEVAWVLELERLVVKHGDDHQDKTISCLWWLTLIATMRGMLQKMTRHACRRKIANLKVLCSIRLLDLPVQKLEAIIYMFFYQDKCLDSQQSLFIYLFIYLFIIIVNPFRLII